MKCKGGCDLAPQVLAQEQNVDEEDMAKAVAAQNGLEGLDTTKMIFGCKAMLSVFDTLVL